jgi:hypothetical protein
MKFIICITLFAIVSYMACELPPRMEIVGKVTLRQSRRDRRKK